MAKTPLWTTIRWKECENKVSKLQRRIVEAYKAKDMLEVQKLTTLLISSFAARALAVRQVVTEHKLLESTELNGILMKRNYLRFMLLKKLHLDDIRLNLCVE